ncbi:MAG: hypothetical protein IPJ04_18060 [Candidatus Eisenbacteria bacterium]|nr:hypothetical protein [Candidatus Eisenbacteria bacterium]
MKRFISTLCLAGVLLSSTVLGLSGCGVGEHTNGPQIHQQQNDAVAVAPVRGSEAAVPFAPIPSAQVLDLTVTNSSPYSVEVWMDTWVHKVIPAGQTAHGCTPASHTAYAKYLAYTAKTTIRGRRVNPRLRWPRRP